MPDRSEYQPLTQNADDDGDVGGGLPQPVTSSFRGMRRAQRPGHIDLSKLDTAFKRYVLASLDHYSGSNDSSENRWKESIAQKVKRKKKVEDNSRKEIWHSVFAPKVEALLVEDTPVRLDCLSCQAYRYNSVRRSRPWIINLL